MRKARYHQHLQRQLDDAGVDTATLPANVAQVLGAIDQTYERLEHEQAESRQTVQLRTDQLIGSVAQAYSFLDSLHMGLVMCDINPEVVLTNAAAQAMLSGASGEKASWTLAEIDAVLGAGWSLRQRVQQCLEESLPAELKEVPCGERVLRLFIAPMANRASGTEQQFGAIILVEDITEQVVLARSKDEFFFIASHELRTPLTAIRGNSSLLLNYRGKFNEAMMSEMMHDIHDSSVRLINIVNDFLDVSALEQGKIETRPESFKLDEAVDEVLRELGSVASAKDDQLTVDESLPNLPAVLADKQRIKQVIYNLIGNAIKFTAGGDIAIGGSFDGRLVHCWVQDTGQGIPSDSHKLLFRKFQQAGGANLLNRDSTKGTGLGLYISKLIMEQSGGTIRLEQSEPGKGSTFSFSLAASRPADSD